MTEPQGPARAPLNPGDPAALRRKITALWWPLASSWLLMAAELPLLAAVIARLPDAEVQLAAHGAVVMPVALVIEAPIIMLLAASTALCRDRAALAVGWRFMMMAGALLTLVHATVVFTPLHDVITLHVLGVPEALVEPSRLGLQLLLPWTWAIAFRRFHQGLLIRAGRSRAVAAGTVVRLATNATVLVAGLAHGGLPGIGVGAAALAAGVTCEAAFVGWQARSTVLSIQATPPRGEPLDLRGFLRFYLPLAATPVLSLSVPPLGAAAISRMPEALPSLAAWPAAFGFVFLVRSVGFALNEVSVSLLDEPGAERALRTFTTRLATATTLVLVLVAATPLARLWFSGVSGLSTELAALAQLAVALAVLMPALTAFEQFHQARLVHTHRTRSVTLGMACFLAVAAAGYAVGIACATFPGIHVAMLVLTAASAAKLAWLARRASRLVPPQAS